MKFNYEKPELKEIDLYLENLFLGNSPGHGVDKDPTEEPGDGD